MRPHQKFAQRGAKEIGEDAQTIKRNESGCTKGLQPYEKIKFFQFGMNCIWRIIHLENSGTSQLPAETYINFAKTKMNAAPGGHGGNGGRGQPPPVRQSRQKRLDEIQALQLLQQALQQSFLSKACFASMEKKACFLFIVVPNDSGDLYSHRPNVPNWKEPVGSIWAKASVPSKVSNTLLKDSTFRPCQFQVDRAYPKNNEGKVIFCCTTRAWEMSTAVDCEECQH